MFPVSANRRKSLTFGGDRESSSPLWSAYEFRVRGTIIIIASDCLSELLICLTLTKCHYLLQRKFTEGILKKSQIYLCRNNYLLSSGDEVIITVETRQFNLTGDQHGHASVSSASISINEAVMDGITIQENPLENSSISISGSRLVVYFLLVSGQMQTMWNIQRNFQGTWKKKNQYG